MIFIMPLVTLCLVFGGAMWVGIHVHKKLASRPGYVWGISPFEWACYAAMIAMFIFSAFLWLLAELGLYRFR